MPTHQQVLFNSSKDKGSEAWRAYLRPFEEGDSNPGLSLLIIYPFVGGLAKDQESLDWAEAAMRADCGELSNDSLNCNRDIQVAF